MKGEETVGVEAGRGELGDHLQKSTLSHEEAGEENQRGKKKPKQQGDGERNSPVSSSGPSMQTFVIFIYFWIERAHSTRYVQVI